MNNLLFKYVDNRLSQKLMFFFYLVYSDLVLFLCLFFPWLNLYCLQSIQNAWFRKSRFKGGKGKKLNIGGGGLGYRERPGLGSENTVSWEYKSNLRIEFWIMDWTRYPLEKASVSSELCVRGSCVQFDLNLITIPKWQWSLNILTFCWRCTYVIHTFLIKHTKKSVKLKVLEAAANSLCSTPELVNQKFKSWHLNYTF